MKRTSILSWVIAGIAFLLPWQTRWMYSAELLDGAHTEYGIMSLFAVELLVAIAMIVAAMTRLSIEARHHLPIRLGAVLCVAIILGTAFADRNLFSLAMATHVLFAYGLFVSLLFEQVSIRLVCGAFVLGLVPSILLGMVQVLTGVSPASSWLGLAARGASQLGDAVFTVDGERVLRAYGTFSHPNVFGGYLGVGLFAWWHVLASFRSKWSTRIYAGIGTFGTALLLFGLLLTGSRSAMLGLLLGLLLTVVARGVRSGVKRTASVLGVATVVIIGSLVASFTLTDLAAELRGGGVNEERSLTERVALYEDFVPFIATTNLVVGRGVGAYVLSYADFDSGKPAYNYQPIHNSFLLFFAETGILGALILLWLLATVVRRHFARLPQRDALTALGMGSVVLIVAFYDHYLWSSWAGLALMAFVLAMMVRMGEE
jgi:O-antigen ligase